MENEGKVKLISSDGFEFIIDRKAAMVSKILRDRLTTPEIQQEEVHLSEIRGFILEKICQYFYWNLQYTSGNITKFPIEPKIAMELMIAGDFLDT